MGRDSIKIVIPVLFAVAGYCVWHLLRDRTFDNKSLFSLHIPRQHIKPIIARFAIGGVLLSIIVYFAAPDQFLALPKNNLELWCAVMLLYPLLSVYPQELIFRSFMFQRYRPLLKDNYIHMILISGILFSFSHLLFNNWQALALTALGGCIIAYTYHRSKSVICASFEHAIWGNLIFTIGLGNHFSGGTIANLLYGSTSALGF